MRTLDPSPLRVLGTTTAVALAAVTFVAACDMAATSTTDPGQAELVPSEPTFVPYTTAPTLVNRQEVVRAMQAAYPPLLREAGIGGTVHVYFYIGTDGRVLATRIHESSGLEPLDQAALAAASVFRFSPAKNHDDVVAVWVSLPVTFRPAQGQPTQASEP